MALPITTPAGSCDATYSRDGGMLRLGLRWVTDSAGDCIFHVETPIVGELVTLSSFHSVPSSTGTYDLTAKDHLGLDVLRGLGETMTVNQATVRSLRDTYTETGEFSRALRFSGPFTFVVNASTSAVHYGTAELLIAEGG